MVSDLPLACLNCAQRQVYAARELFTEKPVALSQIQPLQQRAGALFNFLSRRLRSAWEQSNLAAWAACNCALHAASYLKRGGVVFFGEEARFQEHAYRRAKLISRTRCSSAQSAFAARRLRGGSTHDRPVALPCYFS